MRFTSVRRMFVAGLIALIATAGVPALAAGSISGRVLNPDGDPMGGYRVEATKVGSALVFSTGIARDGSFTLQDLPEGEYEIRIWENKKKRCDSRVDNITLSPDEMKSTTIQLDTMPFCAVVVGPVGDGDSASIGGLSFASKIGIGLGALIGAGVLFEALDDDDEEPAQSPSMPTDT